MKMKESDLCLVWNSNVFMQVFAHQVSLVVLGFSLKGKMVDLSLILTVQRVMDVVQNGQQFTKAPLLSNRCSTSVHLCNCSHSRIKA